MLRHIVMIKLKNGNSSNAVSEKIKTILLNLKKSISELKEMEVGINLSTRSSAMDIVLIADFDDVEGLDKYRVHPEHIKVLDYLKTVADYMKVVDYKM